MTATNVGYVNPQEGDTVRGTYFGTPYTGTVTKLRFHHLTGNAMWYVSTEASAKQILIKLPDALEIVNGCSIELAR